MRHEPATPPPCFFPPFFFLFLFLVRRFGDGLDRIVIVSNPGVPETCTSNVHAASNAERHFGGPVDCFSATGKIDYSGIWGNMT